MNELQKELINLFKTFNKMAEECNTEYMALSGTALGAERHKGFIPWDDDIDVGMKYTDALKFKDYVNNNSTRFKVETYDSDKSHYVFFFKFVDTTIEVVTSYGEVQKLWIDIFMLVPSKKTYISKKRKLFINVMDSVLVKRKRFFNVLKDKNESFLRRIAKVVYYSLFLWIPAYSLIKRDYKKKFTKNTKAVIEYFYTQYAIPLNDFYPLSEGVFEDMTIKTPGNIQKYLEILYGDWRQIPDEANRITHDVELRKTNK